MTTTYLTISNMRGHSSMNLPDIEMLAFAGENIVLIKFKEFLLKRTSE